MITAFGGPEGYFSPTIIAFGALGFIVVKYHYRLGEWKLRSLASLFKEVTVFKDWLFCSADVISTISCAAASEKLHCNIEKAALQESGAFLQRFAAGFKPPRLGTHVSDLEKPVSAKCAVSCNLLQKSAIFWKNLNSAKT